MTGSTGFTGLNNISAKLLRGIISRIIRSIIVRSIVIGRITIIDNRSNIPDKNIRESRIRH